MNKCVYVGFAFDHHKGTHAGYNQIRDYISYDYIIDCQSYFDSFFKFKPHGFFSFVWYKICCVLFNFAKFPTFLLKYWWLGLTHRNLTFHFIYGESLFLPFGRYVGWGNRIVCTIHQPLEVLDRWKLSKNLNKADTLILVSDVELCKFKDRTNKENVIFIPHGISTNFYHPVREIEKEKLILTVGDWLRDYSFANMVFQDILKKDKNVRIVVVSLPRNLCKLKINDDRFEFLSGITDEELRSLYLRSSVLFLPLIRYTANNSLLEAASCGCNIIIASDHPDNSYIPSRFVSLIPMNVDEAVNTILHSYKYDYNLELSDFVRQNYSWEKVGRVTEKILRK